MTAFATAQVEQLLKPIHPARVLNDGKGHAHVSQQDILAHLIRVFGFGGFDIEVLAADCIFEQPREKPGRYDVCYRALVRLTVRNAAGATVARYENGSTATAQNQTRGDAHDLAYKSAISLSVKRAAIALGDQFGLSLYNKGQREALVRGTLVGLDADQPARDMQEGVPQQVALGHDEVDLPLAAEVDETARVYAELDTVEQRPAGVASAHRPPAGQPMPAKPITEAQVRMLGVLMTKNGIKDRAERLAFCGEVLDWTPESSKDLTSKQGSRVIDALQKRLDEAAPTDVSAAEVLPEEATA